VEIPYTVEPRPDSGLANGKLGIWLFLASEVMLFGALFSTYILLRVGAPEWPHGELSVKLGAINTVILICSSVTMVMSWASLKLNDFSKSRVYLLVTIVLASLPRVEHGIRRFRRIVNYTIRTKPGTGLDSLRDTLDAHGITIVSQQAYDHMDDRTYEMRLTGPAIQFETLHETLKARKDVLSVHGGA